VNRRQACHLCVVVGRQPSWQASTESEEEGSGEEEREATNIMDLVTLRIKSPSAALEDLEVKAQVGDTVRELKEQISLAFPTKPPPGEQKLVYLGKILKDSDRLDEVLRLDYSVSAYTLHLVCALPQQREGLRYRPAPAVLPPADAAVVPPPATYTATTQETNQTMEEMMRSFSTQYTTAMSSLPPSPSEAELAALQELYSQYVGLYMQYLSGSAPGTQYQHLVPQPPQQQEVQEGAQGEVQGVQAPGAGLVMNAGGGGAVAADAGGDRNRDILDWVYVMTRVMLLFSVIYFHSSFWRLAFVAGLGFLVFLYQNRQQGRARRPQQVAPVVAPAPVQEVDEQEEREEGEEESEGGEEQEEEEQPKPSRVAVVVTFITSLISSIIPEQNQVI